MGQAGWLVGREINVPFSIKVGYIGDKMGQANAVSPTLIKGSFFPVYYVSVLSSVL